MKRSELTCARSAREASAQTASIGGSPKIKRSLTIQRCSSRRPPAHENRQNFKNQCQEVHIASGWNESDVPKCRLMGTGEESVVIPKSGLPNDSFSWSEWNGGAACLGWKSDGRKVHGTNVGGGRQVISSRGIHAITNGHTWVERMVGSSYGPW